MRLTATEAHDRIVIAVGDDGTVDDQFGDDTHGLWGHYAGYDTYDASGDLRYFAALRDSADLMLGQAAPEVTASDAAAGMIAADQWTAHLRAIRNQAAADFLARVKAIMAQTGVMVAEMYAYTLSPHQPGSRMPDPASRYYLGDPNWPNQYGWPPR